MNMKKRAFLGFGFFVVAIGLAVMLWKPSASSGITTTEEYKQQVRNGLAEVNIPTCNNLNAISSGSDSIVNFIFYRSGV